MAGRTRTGRFRAAMDATRNGVVVRVLESPCHARSVTAPRAHASPHASGNERSAERTILSKQDHLLVWHDLARDHGVLEFHGTLIAPGPPLELHVVADRETGSTGRRVGGRPWDGALGSACEFALLPQVRVVAA